MRRITKLGFALFVLFACFIFSAFAESGKITTGGGPVNVRKQPEDRARIEMTINNGKNVEILDHLDGWYHISYNGRTGYIKEQFIKTPSEAIGKEIFSNGTTLYLRENADVTSRIVGMANAQQAITVEQINDEWALVSINGIRGYIQTKDIDQLNEEPIAIASEKWTEGILQKETTLYRDPDKNSEVLSTWPKG